MLKKLIKYEWKSTLGINLLFCAIILGISLLAMGYFLTPFWRDMFQDDSENSLVAVIGALTAITGVFAYIIMMVGVPFGQTIYFGVRYHRSMFSDEGYLTHTLPVKPWELLFSKCLVAGLWVLLVTVLMIVSAIGILLFGFWALGSELFSDFLSELQMVFADGFLFRELGQYINIPLLLTVWILLLVLTPFLSTGILFASLTLGQYSQKNRGLVGILIWCGVRVVMSLAISLLNFVFSVVSIGSRRPESVMVGGKNAATLIVELLFAAGMIIWAHSVIKNNLNME